MSNWPTRNELLLEALNESVEGHLTAKKALITMLQRSQMRYFQKYIKSMDDENLLEPMKILLIGGSGTGKTHLVNCLEQIVHFPLLKIDATQFNVTGGSGGIKVSKLQTMIRDKAAQMCELYPDSYFTIEGTIDRTIIFVDEIDKLGGTGNVGEWNRGVQSDFLTLFDNKDEFSGVSFVFAGAFSSITNRQEKKKKYSIGFGNTDVDDGEQKMLDEEICSTGLLPELVGRFNYIAQLDVFTEDDLYKILKDRIISKKKRDLATFGIFDVSVPEQKLREMAVNAKKSGQGIRYLKRCVDFEFLEHEFNACINNGVYGEW